MFEIKKKYKILIVDDSRFNRLVLTSMLRNDYLLEEACDGKQATLILQDRAEEFSLVLLDIVMPNMDGFEFLKVMKECGWLDFLPVIMISSEYTRENIETSYRLGASELIQRPYDEQVIYHRIANTIALSNKHRELSNALVDEVIKENADSAAMVSILSHIVETRNGESGSHVQNIRSITAMLLAQLMETTDKYQLSRDEMAQIVTASSLHDIGKMEVPEEILNKPGKLTDEEFRVMKGHAMAGADMVEDLLHQENASPLIRMTYEICRWHHERWDGRGYPDGLKGDEIPIAAQLVSVADVYDALTSERCYKPSYTPEEALKMILEGQCGAFNPLLLDCLTAIFDRLKAPAPAAGSPFIGGTLSNEALVANALAHSRESGLFSSDKIMQTLTRERLRSRFFFNEPCAAFQYTAFPPVLRLNRAARKLLQVEESIVNPDEELSFSRDSDPGQVDRLKSKLALATNTHPMVRDEVLLSFPDEPPRHFQCMMQTVWDSADTQHYTEVLGRLIPMDGEDVLPAEPIPAEFSIEGSSITGRSARYLITALKFMVYNVRLVDPISGQVVELDSSGSLIFSGHHCFEIWKRDQRCDNCTSSSCMQYQREFSKIVFFESEIFYVIAQYVQVDGVPLVLEMLTRITDDALIDATGQKLASKSLADLKDKLYRDSLTSAYNRRYYIAKAQASENIAALAILNVDHFRQLNTTHGRTVGGSLLAAVAHALRDTVHTPDALVRYDGDDFVMMFHSITPDDFATKLSQMCRDLSALPLDHILEGLHITVSIGGAAGPDTPAALMKKADVMLCKAKQQRNTAAIWPNA